MASNLDRGHATSHVVLPDIGRPRMAKANVQILDTTHWLVLVGRSVSRAIARLGWSQKEAAAKIGVDEAELGKWLNGVRRPQLDKLFAVEALRQPLIEELADLAGAEVTTQIRFARAVNA